MKNDSALKNIRIVMVTTAGRPQDQQRCREAGCDEILLKPINRTEFVATAQRMSQLPTRSERYKAKLQVRYGQNTDKMLSDFSIDISSGGLFIETDSPLEVDQQFKIGFTLPDPKRDVNCSAQVAWVNLPLSPIKTARPPGMGVRFIDLSLDDLHAVSNYIENNQLDPA